MRIRQRTHDSLLIPDTKASSMLRQRLSAEISAFLNAALLRSLLPLPPVLE